MCDYIELDLSILWSWFWIGGRIYFLEWIKFFDGIFCIM